MTRYKNSTSEQRCAIVVWVLCASPLPEGHAPASYCSFILGPKIERHETALNPAWSGAVDVLTHQPTGKDIGLLLETMEICGGGGHC